MKNSSLNILLAVAGLMSQTFGAVLPAYDPDPLNNDDPDTIYDDEEMAAIDVVLKNAMIEAGLDPDTLDDPLRVEYDIALTEEQYQAMQETDFHKRTAALKDVNKRWTNGVVNYMIEDGSFSTEEKASIKLALDEIKHYTCLTFKETTTETNRVEVKNAAGCFSYLGMIGGNQTLGLGNGCRHHRTIVHEFVHALGFTHEQNRYDRDNYVTIVWDNIDDSHAHNFDKKDWDYLNNFTNPYDYYSVMHYSQYAFYKVSGKPTIIAKDSTVQTLIGKPPGLSFGDIKTINSMYSCVPESCSLKDSDCGDGYVGKDCKCWCKGPELWHPVEYCSQADKDANGSLNFVGSCFNDKSTCDSLKDGGHCTISLNYMLRHCRKSCNFC